MRLASKWVRLMMLLIAALSIGCGYSEVSPATYQYAKALYSVANRQASGPLDDIGAKIAAAQDAGEINARERKYLDEILDDARAERWEAATQAARSLMEAQIE